MHAHIRVGKSRGTTIELILEHIPQTIALPNIPALMLMINLSQYDGEDIWLNMQSVFFLRQVLTHGQDDAKRVCLSLLRLLDGMPSKLRKPLAKVLCQRPAGAFTNGEITHFRERVFDHDTISIICRLLRTGSSDIKKNILQCIGSFTSTDFRDRVLKSDIIVVTRRLLGGTRDVKYPAIRLFSSRGGTPRSQSYTPEATTLVESMLRDDKGGAWFATECLSGLTKSGDTEGSRVRVIISALQPLLRTGNNEAKMLALKVILGLAQIGGDGCDVTELSQPIINIFQEILRHGSKIDKYISIRAFCYHTSGTFRSMSYIPEVTTILQEMLLDDKGDAREIVARLFSELWASGLHGEVFTAETLSVFNRLLRTDNEEGRMFAFKLIFDLAQQGGDTKFSQPVIELFHDLLRSSSRSSKYAAIRAFCYHTN
ncbi:armadillo-type protein, partial [Gautieria morchelliformis]